MTPRRRPASLTARTADKYELYERAVQAPDFDIRFIERVFRRAGARPPIALREDFCGTAFLAAEWVLSRPDRVAVGIDLNREPLREARRRHVPRLGAAAGRLRLARGDVRRVRGTPADVVVAFNYSYNVFHRRADLLRYFRRARAALRPGGAFILDGYSGPDALAPLEETRRCRGFTYVWDQRPMDALSGRARRYIHFRFRDGTVLRRAFSYDWRLWTVPELVDVLAEAGFRRIDTYNGDEVYRQVRRARYEGALIPLLVAWRSEP